MDSQSLDIAMTLNFGTPVMVLGRMGTGKYFFARRAINFIGGNHIHIDSYELRNENLNSLKDFGKPLNARSNVMQKVDEEILKNKDAIVYYTSIEYIKPCWMMHMLQQICEGRKVLAVGEEFYFEPVMERCKVVQL